MGEIPKPPQGSFNILYFAAAGTFTAREYDVLAAPLPVLKLFDALEDKHPGIKDKVLCSCLVTVNLEYVDVPSGEEPAVDGQRGAEIMIQDGDEVAIIPPVSSG
ncbi:molybdopterin synthase sulfur carrier subunit [Xylariaceae sp. FL0016]|nr:molybdopterin synthase sulfur carrier subunit [Xylariaceae sp. FL0016]